MNSGMESTGFLDAQSESEGKMPVAVANDEVDNDQPDSNVYNEAANVSALAADDAAPSINELAVAFSQQPPVDEPDSGEPDAVAATEVDDEGEIVSDGEVEETNVGGAALADEVDSTTTSTAVAQTLDGGQQAELSEVAQPSEVVDEVTLTASQKRQHDDHSSATAAADDGESQSKKSALEHLRNMKFSKSDPFNDTANSLRFNREEADANARRKRGPVDDERDKRRKFRSGVSSSSHVSSSTDNNNSGGPSVDNQKRQRSTMYFLKQSSDQPPAGHSPAHAFYHHNNLPAPLKGVLQTSGHLRHKLESLLSLKDDQVFGLSTEDMECLLMYAFELSVEQDRLLVGRKAQLKQLDQMIQKERDLVDRLVQDLPGPARANISEMLNGKSPNASVNPPISAAGPAVANAPSMANFSVPPPGFGSDPMKSIGGPPAPGHFMQPPPVVVGCASANSSGHDPSAPQPPPSDFSKPPPSLAVHPQPTADGNLLQPPPAAVISFSAPPPPIIHTSSISMGSATQIPVNTFVPPPKIAPVVQPPAVSAASAIVSSTVGPLTKFSAPPPPTDFSQPPPATAKPSDDVSQASSPNIANIASQAAFKSSTDKPIFKITSSPSIASSNIMAALDLSVPPPSLMHAPLDAGSKTKSFHNLSQPPPNIAKPPSTMQRISQSIMASVAASLKPNGPPIATHLSPQRVPAEPSAPRPLMSINQRPPANFRPAVSSAIPSLASVSRNSITIKRPLKAKNQGGKAIKKNLQKPVKTEPENNDADSTVTKTEEASISEKKMTAADSIAIAVSTPLAVTAEDMKNEIVTTTEVVATQELLAMPEVDSSSTEPTPSSFQQVAVTEVRPANATLPPTAIAADNNTESTS